MPPASALHRSLIPDDEPSAAKLVAVAAERCPLDVAQAAAFDLGRRALAGEDLDVLVDELLASVQRALAPDLITLLELLPGGRSGLVRGGRGRREAGEAREPLPVGADTQGAVALGERRPVVVEDFAHQPAAMWPAHLRAQGVRSGIAVPIAGPGGDPYGLLAVHWRAPRRFEPGEIAFLESLGLVVSASLHAARADDEIRHRSLHDTLTDLPNRLLLLDRLGQALRRTTADAPAAAVLLIGLDRFRLINESLGHRAGDELLRAVVARLRGRLAGADTLARLGGDLFAVLCEDVDGERGALARAEGVTDALTAAFWLDETEVFVSATIGIAVATADSATPDAMLREADVALYRAKRHGGGHCELFGRDSRRRLLDRLHMEAELRRGIDDDQLRLVYQPLVSLEDARIVGAEALVRWEHPERGIVMPADFVPLAEDTGLIVPIGAWVIEEACRQLARWSAAGLAAELPYIAVNVSGRQLVVDDLPAVVARALERTGIAPSRLALEITESVLMERTASPTSVLQDLRALGVRLFLDDFGSGYSSLSYLKRFPLDALKIDQSFVSGIADRGHDLHLVEAIVGIASALGLQTVAEGVETCEQVEILLDLGCHIAQGYHFARPMPPAGIQDLLRAGLQLETGARPNRRPAARTSEAPAEPAADAQTPMAGTITLGEAAEALGVSASTLRRWEENGRIHAVRTPGGHRRFTVAEVTRLNAERGTAPACTVRPIAPPAQPLDVVRALVDQRGMDVAGAAARALYGGDGPPGWFAADDAVGPLKRWIWALASACRSGDYAIAHESTLALSRHAQLAGASLLERHRFVELFGDVAIRALATRDVEREKVAEARRLFVSLRQGLLASATAA
jgi:diguanylate cyclase (GGDEF)-like protein/excisionase family DNA binding protein